MSHHEFSSVERNGIEDGAMAQIMNITKLPFLNALAIMPDVHQGYGVPIGCVLATDCRIIIPNAVGVDIGCGMLAIKTNCKRDEMSRQILQDIVARIRYYVPVGFSKHEKKCLTGDMPTFCNTPHFIQGEHFANAQRSLGTLGGGNHFIEIQAGVNEDVWIMIHSGSRNLGKVVCDEFNAIAKSTNERNYSKVETEWDLAFLEHSSNAYDDYVTCMHYCIDFARRNRAKILDGVKSAFAEVLGPSCLKMPWYGPFDIVHNHASLEHHMGRNVWVHRKGAAGPYRKDTVGIIPGSQGTNSFIVTYRDDAPVTAMCTTSHGAGRKMSRSAAKRNLDLAAEQAAMENIVHSVTCTGSLDEAPGAYKDIKGVIKAQMDLKMIDIVETLEPLAVVKG